MTVKTPITSTTKLTILKHLASGKSLDVVATIVDRDRSEVLDVASHHGYPDREKLEWAADILAKNITDADTAIRERATVPVPAVKPTPAPKTITPSPAAAPPPAAAPAPLTQPDEIRVLLNTAKGHESKRIQNAANKVIDDLDRLRTLLREDQEKHAARRKAEREKAAARKKAEEEKAAARAEVERLEAQLAEARAKLRGPKKTKAAKASTNTASRERGPLDYPCRNDGCDKAYDTPQGRSMHERMKCEHRAEAVAS